ncbi:MAG: PqqD family protein [Ruminococcaceae bacterium]|nr:PqqD family protein [Oscillospiraceae bacterium]
MKLKYNFVINEVAGQKIALPIDCGYGEQSVIKTNETGAFILEILKNDITKQEILEKINQEFSVESQETLENWLDNFLEKLKNAEVLSDD